MHFPSKYKLLINLFKSYKRVLISADSSKLEVKCKNAAETGGISCYDVEFRIIGEHGLVSVMLVQKGCYR